jgi:hypothetical protein
VEAVVYDVVQALLKKQLAIATSTLGLPCELKVWIHSYADVCVPCLWVTTGRPHPIPFLLRCRTLCGTCGSAGCAWAPVTNCTCNTTLVDSPQGRALIVCKPMASHNAHHHLPTFCQA